MQYPNITQLTAGFIIYLSLFIVNTGLTFILCNYLSILPKWFKNFTKIHNELDNNKSQNFISKPNLLKYHLNYLLIPCLIIFYLIFSFGASFYTILNTDSKSYIIGLVSNILVFFIYGIISIIFDNHMENYINKNYEKSIIKYMKSIENEIDGFCVFPEIMNDESSSIDFFKRFNINDYYKIKGVGKNYMKLIQTINHKITI